MKFLKSTIAIISIMISYIAMAGAPQYSLKGITVDHQRHGYISLQSLDKGHWNIVCNYKIRETNGATAPDASNPFAIKITLYHIWSGWHVAGTGYTNKGIINSSGTLEFDNVFNGDFSNRLEFFNYDTTGDLILSHCKARISLA